jgi:two-component system cell cycle sensor histidine kinase/response regulator CckA
VYLPEAAEAVRRASESPPHNGSGTILVADDHESVRNEIRETLTKAGYKVILASGGADAIALYHKHAARLDLALVDVIMPQPDGRDVIQDILQSDPTATLIMMCGFSREYLRSYLPAGNWRFLQKPFDADQLLGAVRRTLEQKSS